uniref:DUF3615 domain-containing protein n=1 Tax=Aegilops tauschii subsp. strangulata TaxID=200361 RepID=A0A453PFU6_AEGTS
MDPQAGGLNFPSVYVPGDGTRAGHFAPRWTVPDFYANYTPQPPLPGTRAGHFLPRGTAPEFYANYTPQPPPPGFTMDNVSAVDIAVRHYLYLPDGTRKHSGIYDKISDNQRQLVLALVDKYNDDNSLLEDLAYELTKVVCYKSFCEADIRMWYHHINFTAKAKGRVDCKFFAEVIFMQGELPVSCLCMIAPTDDGHCFSCRNNGNDLKHPKDVRYAGGHVMRTFNPFGGHKVPPEACVHDWEAEEARFRKSLEGFDLSGPPPIFPGNVANVYIGPSLWEGGRWRTEAAAKVGAGAEC